MDLPIASSRGMPVSVTHASFTSASVPSGSFVQAFASGERRNIVANLRSLSRSASSYRLRSVMSCAVPRSRTTVPVESFVASPLAMCQPRAPSSRTYSTSTA